jgi:hypothetical protein
MKFTHLLRTDGGVYGGFDNCDYSDLGCSSTNPIGFFLWFVGFLIVSGIFYLIKEKISETSYQMSARKQIREDNLMNEWENKRKQERLEWYRSNGLDTPEELQRDAEKIIRRIKNSKKKKTTKKKTTKKKTTKKKT